MSLTLASALLAQPVIGLTEIKEFASLCRDGTPSADAESAALLLLAEKAGGFYERFEGIALTCHALHGFVAQLAQDVDNLRVASAAGDAALVQALNLFAASFSSDIVL